MDSHEGTRPNLFQYLDLASFLTDYYLHKKSKRKGFSYEAWAAELGFKSRSYLRMVVFGKKKATAGFVAIFSEKELITEAEREYFHFLVQYSQASTQRNRLIFSRKLIHAMHAAMGQQEVGPHEVLLADTLQPRLLALLSFEDLVTTPRLLSQLLNVDQEEVEERLRRLEAAGLVEEKSVDGEGRWVTTNHDFKVPDKLGDRTLARFHERVLGEAVEALSMPKEQRRFRSLIVPLSEKELLEFYGSMDTFARELLVKFRSSELQDRRLFQINMNVFPVSSRPIGESAPDLETHLSPTVALDQ